MVCRAPEKEEGYRAPEKEEGVECNSVEVQGGLEVHTKTLGRPMGGTETGGTGQRVGLVGRRRE